MDFIYKIDNNLTSELCRQIIDGYEIDERKYKGKTAGGVNEDVKRTCDLSISQHWEWRHVNKILHENLTEAIEKYNTHIQSKLNFEWKAHDLENIAHTGFQIQKYEEGGFYNYHVDSLGNDDRIIAFIWYLNTLKPDQGGETEFSCDFKNTPKEGSLILFPTNWTYIHKSNILNYGSKYIITGWIKSVLPPPPCDKE